ncbi:hypothetical protein [Ferruginibacter sp.]|nr:hypothetical protein [Ferruginibacter sp.]
MALTLNTTIFYQPVVPTAHVATIDGCYSYRVDDLCPFTTDDALMV